MTRRTVSVAPLSSFDTAITTVVGKGTSSFWGKTRHYMVFYSQSKRTTLYWFDYIADNIGIYFNEVEPGVQQALLGARVNGEQYGIIASVVAQRDDYPKSVVLHQNYPNPFNSSTTISFHLSKPAHLEISIWNSLGERVRQLLEGTYDVGFHAVRWNGNLTYNSQAHEIKEPPANCQRLPCSGGPHFPLCATLQGLREAHSHLSRLCNWWT